MVDENNEVPVEDVEVDEDTTEDIEVEDDEEDKEDE